MGDELDFEEKSYLSLVLSEEDIEQFGDPSNSLTLIKKGAECWQAPVVIGIHAFFSLRQRESNVAELR